MAAVEATAALDRRLRLVGLAAFGSLAAMRGCDPMLVTLSQEFGRTVGEASRVVSAFAVAYGLCQLGYGPLGDRIGKLRVVVAATGACAVVAAVVALAPSFDALVAARALGGAAAAGIVPMGIAWIGDTVPYALRQQTLARLTTATVTGTVAGQWAGAWITEAFGWRTCFWLLAAVFALASATLGRSLPGPAPSAGEVPGSPMATAGAGVPPDAGRPSRAAIRGLLALGRVRWVLSLTALEGAAMFGALAFVPAQLSARHGLGTAAAGSALGLFGVGGFVYSRTAARLVSRRSEAQLARGCAGLLLAALALVGLTPWWWVTLPACFAAGLGFYTLHGILQTRATQMAPRVRGRAVTLFAGMLFLGQSVGVALAALAADRGRTWVVFVVSGPVLALVALAVAAGRGGRQVAESG